MTLILRRFIFLLAFGLSFSAYSAPAPPPSAAGGPSCWPPPCVPIDGGIGFLMAAGAAYGAKKMLEKRKRGSKATQ